MMSNNIEFPSYLPFKKRTYAIVNFIEDTEEFKDNKGYIEKETGNIYICSKEYDPLHKDVPILYVNDDNTYTKKDSSNSETHDLFNINNMKNNLYNLSIENIIENTSEDDELYNEQALADMNAATAIFVPIINENDDPLKKLVKQTIISKEIDINRLKHKMPQKYGITNMKSALVGKTKMSISNFMIWCELLSVDYDVIISDNGTDNINPLKEDIYYSSHGSDIKTIPKIKECINKFLSKILKK